MWLRYPRAVRRPSSMMPLIASVGPLLVLPVSKWAKRRLSTFAGSGPGGRSRGWGRSVAQGVLPVPAAHLIERVTGGLDDMEAAWHAGGVAGLVIDGVFAPLGTGPKSRWCLGAELLAALGQPVAVDRAGPAWHQIQQAGRGTVPSPGQVHDAGDLLGSPAAPPLVVPHARRPPAPARLRNGTDHQQLR